jgi:serine protease Do
MATELGLPDSKGVRVASIYPQEGGSPAARAGLTGGDVILRWKDSPVNSPAQLSALVGRTPVGSKAEVTVWRDGQELRFEVTVGERPNFD